MDDPHASTLSQPNPVQGLRTSVRSHVQASSWRPPYVAGAAYTNWAGSHRLRTHCSFSSRDLRSIEVSTRLLGEAFVSMQMGAARLHNRRIYRETIGGGHTMGTTRMGTAVADSVCDATLRVHGYDNLYLAGSSVFPTGGAANPTLTMAALSFRLGEHVRGRLA